MPQPAAAQVEARPVGEARATQVRDEHQQLDGDADGRADAEQCFLAGVSAVLVIAAPVLMRLFLDGSFFTPGLAPQRDSVIAFARYCVPQVIFGCGL